MWGACAGAGHERELRGKKIKAWVWQTLQKINNNLQTGLVVKSWLSALPSRFPRSLCRMKNLQTHLSLAPPPLPPHILSAFFWFSPPPPHPTPGLSPLSSHRWQTFLVLLQQTLCFPETGIEEGGILWRCRRDSEVVRGIISIVWREKWPRVTTPTHKPSKPTINIQPASV